MRQSIALLVVILIGLAAYTAYGLITFEPDEARPFVFAEPTLPPELQAEYDAMKSASEAPAMSEAQQQQQNAAMSQLTQAVTLYQAYEKDATPQAVSTFSLINSAVLNGKLPAYLLSQSRNPSQIRAFELVTLDPKKNLSIKDGQAKISCTEAGTTFDVLTGDNGDNRLECEAAASPVALDRVFLGGPGNDTIVSAHGSRIINAGTGDDTITAGDGRTIILLDDAWGKDSLTVDCSAVKVEKSEIPQGFPIPWVHDYVNFIVLSPRLNPADISWNGLVLTNKTTGDTLTVNENCFNLVSAAN